MEERALAAEVGRGLKRFRELHELRQDDVARAARHVGLPWTRSVVVALEAGRRYLTIDEFARLPMIGSRLAAPLWSARLEAEGSSIESTAFGEQPKTLRLEVTVPVSGETEESNLAAYRAAGADLEQKVARRFGLDPVIVALVALAMPGWGRRSLTEQRDRRVAEQAPAGTSARAIQALRGHVTRGLLKEIGPRLAQARQRLAEEARQRKKGGRR